MPPPHPLARYTGPLPEHRDVVVTEGHKDPEISPRRNEGRPVFRVREGYDRKISASYFGLILGGISGLILLSITDKAWWFAITVPIGIAFAIFKLGKARDLCSGPGCARAELPPDATVCASCGGVISGRIGSFREHYDAEEALTGESEFTREAIG